tara:strand:- start:1788 stop:2783 length:996 start_codon:yes stop_codon:yes gene_type:complete
MEITEVKKVKLNVTNIKSVLIRSNKKFRNVEKKKSYLTRRQEEQEKRILLEKKIEGSPLRKIPKIPVLGGAIGVARSIWDRLVNFFGWLLVGFLVTRLPQIIENLKRTFAFIKPIWEGAMKTFAIIGKGMGALFTGISSLFNLNKSTKDLQKAESDLKDLDAELKGMDRDLKSVGDDTEERPSSTPSNSGNDNITQSSPVKWNNPWEGDNLESTGQVMRQELLKQDNKIQTKSKKIKEKKQREVKDHRLDSKLDGNIKVRPKTAPFILNQKGPLDIDQDIPKGDLVVVERTKVKWWNPATWNRGGGNNNPSSTTSTPNTLKMLDGSVMELP